MKIHLLHPLCPCRLSPRWLRTSKTQCPRLPPGSPPSPQSNRWNISDQSCQILVLLWTCGFGSSPLSHRCSKLAQSSSHIHTHSLRPAPNDHAATHKHIRTETLLIWQQLLGFWPLLPANHLPYSCLSHSLPLSASFSRLLLGNYSAEPSHSRDIERRVSVLPCNTHKYLKPNLSCAG